MPLFEIDLARCTVGRLCNQYGCMLDMDNASGDIHIYNLNDGTEIDYCCADLSNEPDYVPPNYWTICDLDDHDAPWRLFSARAAEMMDCGGSRRVAVLTNSPEYRAWKRICEDITAEIRRLRPGQKVLYGAEQTSPNLPRHSFELIRWQQGPMQDEYAALIETPDRNRQFYDMRGNAVYPHAWTYCDPRRTWSTPWCAFVCFAASWVVRHGLSEDQLYLRNSLAFQKWLSRANDVQWELAKRRGTTHLWPVQEVQQRTDRVAQAVPW